MTLQNWHSTKLGELIETNSETYSARDGWEYINYLDTGNITDNRIDEISELKVGTDKIPSRAKRKVRNGDVIFSTVRPNQRHFGIIKSQPANFLVSTGFTTIRAKPEKASNAFIYWYLSQPSIVDFLHGVGETSTSAYPSIKPSDIEGLKLLLPPLSEQKAIASVLGALDDKIKNNRRMNETLEEMARAIFKSWFVDFDPVHAKAAGNEPAHMDAETAALFPNSFGDDGLPAGWNKNELTQYATLNSKSHNARNAPEEVWYADLANTKNGKIESYDHFLWSDAPSRAKRILEEGDTIVGTVRPGNRSFAYIGKSERPTTGSTGFAVLTPTKREFRELVYCAATSNENIDRLAHLADGAAYPAVKPNIVSETLVSISNEKLIFAFHLQTVSLLTKITTNISENQTLAELRDTLLPKLMSGEIRVKDAEREVEAAV